MDTFVAAAIEGFELRLVEHLLKFAPRYGATIGRAGLRAVVRRASADAAHYGLVSERSVRYYTEVALMLGPDLDRSLAFPWTRELLSGDHGAESRIDQLVARAWEHVARVAPDVEACERDRGATIRRVLEEITAEADVSLDRGGEDRCHRFVRDRLLPMLPCTHATLGEVIVADVVRSAVGSARKRGAGTAWAASVASALALLHAGSFGSDPRMPWVDVILEDPQGDAFHRAERLVRGADEHARAFWS
jgi:hypothetical protein